MRHGNRTAFALRTRTAGEPEPDLTSMMVTQRAIRQDLRRLSACLDDLAGTGVPPARAAAITRYTAALLAEIRAHHENQDRIVWPVIAAIAGQSVALAPLTDDHQAIQAGVNRAGLALAAGLAPGTLDEARAAVGALCDMLDDHITDEQRQILPVMRRYLPADVYRRCEEQTWRRTSLPRLRFTLPWLARYASPDELRRLLAAAGWRVRLMKAVTHPGYARLERQAFKCRPPA